MIKNLVQKYTVENMKQELKDGEHDEFYKHFFQASKEKLSKKFLIQSDLDVLKHKYLFPFGQIGPIERQFVDMSKLEDKNEESLFDLLQKQGEAVLNQETKLQS